MSLPTRQVLAFVVFAAGCATGGQSSSGNDAAGSDVPGQADAAITHDDANTSMLPDAPGALPDASVPTPDAFVPPDAPPNSLFCSDNAQCTTPGECCLTFGQPMGFCAPGTIVLGACVPIT
jgi:hypothetical protein